MKDQKPFPIWLVLGLGIAFAGLFIFLQLTTGYPLKFFTPPTSTFTPLPPPTNTEMPTETNTVVPSPTSTETSIPTDTQLPTDTPTITPTFTPSDTPLPSETPTPEQLTATGTGFGFCNWGPDPDYLSSYVISEGELMVVNGRDWDGYWFWVQPIGLAWSCWVTESVLEFSGDKMSAEFVTTFVPTTGEVTIPSGVSAVRNGGNVTISWNPSPFALEQHYLLQVRVCRNGLLIDDAIQTTATSITIADATSCGSSSYGVLRGADKRGYSTHVNIPWP